MSRVAVVGAGLTGLTAGLRLQQEGHQVRLFERYPEAGGLARDFEIGGEPLEVFYHHVFTSDTHLIELAGELGLGDALEWLPSRMGIWARGRLWDFATPRSLLAFKPLSWLDKVRFALGTLYLQYRADPRPFERVTAAQWVRRHQGRRVWEMVWGPLFQQKFAERATEVAMVWLWGKMRLRGRSRSRGGMGERLGYMQGSFGRLVRALADRVVEQGAELRLGDRVRRIDRADGGFELRSRSGTWPADAVLVAAPITDYLEIAGHLLDQERARRLGTLSSTAALCTVLELEQQLTPYYWLNIADAEMPFGGLIEHTNFVPRQRYGGRHVLYISNYVFPDSPLYRKSKRDLLELYLPGLQRINPSFDGSWILASHHFRAESAQPVVTVGYHEEIPDLRARVDGLYVASMAQVYPWDRGQNYAIAYGEAAARGIIDDLG